MNRELKQLLKFNTKALQDSEQDLKAIYDITFRKENAHLIMAEDNDGYRIHTYTYGQIKQRIEAAADGLFAALGETHGFVGLDMEAGVDWIVAFWGILKSGNKPFLINAHHPDSMTLSLLKTLQITTVISHKAGTLPIRYVPFGEWECSAPCTAQFENELAIATSATSLKKSLCFYTGQNIAAQIFNTREVLSQSKRMARHYKGQLKQLAFLPFYHIFGLFAVYFWFTFYNRTLVFVKDLSPETLLGTCRLHQVTHIFAVPLLWHTVEQQVWSAAKAQGREQQLKKGLSLCTKLQNLFPYAGATLAKKLMSSVTDQLFGPSVQFCISGGSALRHSALELMNGLGYPLHNGYGMSEIGIAAVDLSTRPKDRNHGNIGKVFSSLHHQITKEGELQVTGSSVCHRRMINGEEFRSEGWFATGDLVEQHKNGALSIIGRMSDVVIGESGENINPDTIEPLFFTDLAVNYSVLGLPCSQGEELCLVLQLPATLSDGQINELYEHMMRINATLPLPLQVRKLYATQDAIMASTAIKVSRAYLRRGVSNGQITLTNLREFVPCADSACEDSEILQQIIRLTAELLGREEETLLPDAQLLQDLGVSSLQYFALLSALEEHFDFVPHGEEQYGYTLREFSRMIERRNNP